MSLKKTLFYISNSGNNTISIMDMDTMSFTEVINLPFQPLKMCNIANKVYVSSNGNVMAVISIDDNHMEILDIPSNGNILVNKKYHHLYASNISEVSVYDTNTYNLISTIKPFGIVDYFQLNSDESKIFIVDLLKKDLKIYDCVTLKLLYKIENIGIKPYCALVSDNNKTAYVVSKSVENLKSCYIYVIDIENNDRLNISLDNNSLITSLALKNNILYACNKGLNRIEVIDTLTNCLIKSIPTTLPNPQDLLLIPDKNILMVINKNPGGTGCLDLININTNTIITPLNIPGDTPEPCHIIKITKDNQLSIGQVEHNKNNEELIPVTIKRFLTSHIDDISFSNIIVSLPQNYHWPLSLHNISFKEALIINHTISQDPDKDDYFNISFVMKIPYIIKLKDRNSKIVTIKKFLMDSKSFKLQISNINKKHKMNLVINSNCKISNNPLLLKDLLKFSIQANITLKIFSEFQSMLPLSVLEN